MITIHLQQTNPILGAASTNLEVIAQAYNEAASQLDQHAIVAFPAMALWAAEFSPSPSIETIEQFVASLVALTEDHAPALLIGITASEALLFHRGQIIGEANEHSPIVTFCGKRIGIILDYENSLKHALSLRAAGADQLVVMANVPYATHPSLPPLEHIPHIANTIERPVSYLSIVGGQEERIFDGHSLTVDSEGTIIHALPRFEVASSSTPSSMIAMSTEEADYSALLLWLRDYITKKQSKGILLSVSGGIDSALAYVLAVDALGADRVRPVLMPSKYTSHSIYEDIDTMIGRLGTHSSMLSIDASFHALFETLLSAEKEVSDHTEEQLTHSLRGVLLMALSSNSGECILTATNKTEWATGQAMSYVGLAESVNLLQDVYKTRVYALAHWRNHHLPKGALGPEGEIIPPMVFERTPSSMDETALPHYAAIDPILHCLIEESGTIEEAVRRGHDQEMVESVLEMLYRSEYKRRQSGPGVKISSVGLGLDRRYPLIPVIEDKILGTKREVCYSN